MTSEETPNDLVLIIGNGEPGGTRVLRSKGRTGLYKSDLSKSFPF